MKMLKVCRLPSVPFGFAHPVPLTMRCQERWWGDGEGVLFAKGLPPRAIATAGDSQTGDSMASCFTMGQ